MAMEIDCVVVAAPVLGALDVSVRDQVGEDPLRGADGSDVEFLGLDAFIPVVAFEEGRDHLATGSEAAGGTDLPELRVEKFVESVKGTADDGTQKCAFEVDQMLRALDYANVWRPVLSATPAPQSDRLAASRAGCRFPMSRSPVDVVGFRHTPAAGAAPSVRLDRRSQRVSTIGDAFADCSQRRSHLH